MGGRAVRARFFWTAGMVLMTIGQTASANAAPRDRFFWLTEINKASAEALLISVSQKNRSRGAAFAEAVWPIVIKTIPAVQKKRARTARPPILSISDPDSTITPPLARASAGQP